MGKAYKKTAQVGIIKACLRFIEDPNRKMYQRVFLALSPLLIVWILSPLDLLPEVVLGPLGLTDDVIILIGLFLLIRLANSFYKEKRFIYTDKSKDNTEIIDV